MSKIYNYLVTVDADGDIVEVKRYGPGDDSLAVEAYAIREQHVRKDWEVYLLGTDRFETLLSTHGNIFAPAATLRGVQEVFRILRDIEVPDDIEIFPKTGGYGG